jgi:hypothetical protein
MREGRIGRVLVASLHQAIGEILPLRLGFYEHWLHAEGLRDGSIGVAQLSAVLSFLRQEGAPYQAVTARAGEYAAEWTFASMRPVTRAAIARLPRVARRRVLLRRAAALVRSSYDGTRMTWLVRQGTATVTVRDSIFCSVRSTVPLPLCGYYASMLERLFALFAVPAVATVNTCRASGGHSCEIKIPFGAVVDADAEAAA